MLFEFVADKKLAVNRGSGNLFLPEKRRAGVEQGAFVRNFHQIIGYTIIFKIGQKLFRKLIGADDILSANCRTDIIIHTYVFHFIAFRTAL